MLKAIYEFLIDPLAEKYVHNSTYAFSENKVTSHVEIEGLEAAKVKKIKEQSVGDKIGNYLASIVPEGLKMEFNASIGPQVGFEI